MRQNCKFHFFIAANMLCIHIQHTILNLKIFAHHLNYNKIHFLKAGRPMDKKKQVKPEHISQEIYDLFDDYVHSRIDRRGFLNGVSKFTMAGLTASAILDYLSPQYAEAQQVSPDDPRLSSNFIEYQSPNGSGTMRALLAQKAHSDKKGKHKRPGIVVVHENRGLNPHIEDVTRRAALEGYIALGPDALTPLGGYPGNDDDGRDLQSTLDRDQILEDFIAGYEYLKDHPDCNGRIGVVGFCFGGWVANMMSVRIPSLDAAVPFYGSQAPLEEVPAINAPLLMQFAENDARVNEGWPPYEEALIANHKKYKVYTYAGTQHGFHNDTTPRYSPEAAQLAWERTIMFFDKHLDKKHKH